MYISIQDIKYYTIQLREFIESDTHLTPQEIEIVYKTYRWLSNNISIYLKQRRKEK